MAQPQIPSREDVIAACERDWPLSNRFASNGFAYDDQIYIKYGEGVTLAEAEMQRFVYENADHNIVYTPKVYEAFTIPRPHGEPNMTYIVMERMHNEPCDSYLKAHPDEATTVVEAVAKAVRHVWNLPLPPNSSIGPIGDQIPSDRFFSGTGAGRTFNTVAELETWVNNILFKANKGCEISLQSQKVSIRHLDLSQYNVLVGKPIVLIDWGFSGSYPIDFEEFALVHQFNSGGSKFARLLHRILFGEKPSKQMRPLGLTASINAFGQ